MTFRGYLTRLIWLCVLPLVILAAVIAAVQLRTIQAERLRDAENLALLVAADIESHLRSLSRGLTMIAASPFALDVSQRDLWLAEARAFAGAFGTNVVIADDTNRIILSTAARPAAPLPALPRPPGRGAADAALASGRPAAGDVFFGPIQQRRLVAVAAPAPPEAAGRFVVVATVTVDALQDRLARAKLPEGWLLSLRDTSGELIGSVGTPSSGKVRLHERRVGEQLTGGWSLALDIGEGLGDPAVVRAAIVLLVAVLGLGAAALLAGTVGSLRLARAVQSLAGAEPESGAGVELAEISAARSRLREANAQRDRAEADRRESEQAFRRQLEQAAEALAASEASLRAIFESASEAILTISPARRITLVNRAGAAMFGYAAADLIDRCIDTLIPARLPTPREGADPTRPNDAPAPAPAVGASESASADSIGGGAGPTRSERISLEEASGLTDYRLPRRGSGDMWIGSVSVAPIRSEGGEITGSVIIVRDKTEQRRREEALAQAHRLLALAERAAGAGLWSRDAATGELTWSDALFNLLGLDRATTPANDAVWRSLVQPDDLDTIDRALREAIQGRSPFHVRMRLRCPAGGIRWIDAYGDTDYAEDGRALRTSGISIDSTRLVEAEQHLRQLVGELEVAEDRERRRIAQDLHDDLGQSLAAARIRLAALRETLTSEAGDAARRVDELLDQVERGVRSLAAQLAPAALYELGLVPALDTLTAEIRHTYGVETVIVDDGADKPLPIDSRSILYRAVRELLINVAKHARTDVATVEVERRGGEIIVRVSDGGAGFDAALSETAAPRSLGLASVRERLPLVGGQMAIRSRPGQGTVVELTAPLGSRDDTSGEAV